MKIIGLMSGTSVDGIDVALIEVTGKKLELNINLLDSKIIPYPPKLRSQILAVAGGKTLNLAELADLDDTIATLFAKAAQNIAENQQDIALIGSHGQTVYHRPKTDENLGYSLQLGRGELIANLTGIPTVSNFRVSDIAAYGQGAPLVSKVDAALLAHPTKIRCIQNIGGISNLTYLPSKQTQNWEAKILGWDTGPGNILLDLAIQELTQGSQTFDEDGNWASVGKPELDLVNQWLKADFFQIPPPKSTGRELFGQEYLTQCAQLAKKLQLTPADWLATLTEFTVRSIVKNYQEFLPQMPDEVLLCGGGSNNLYLKKRLQTLLGEKITVLTTDTMGISVKFKEAIAFGILAYWRFFDNFPGNLPQVTGSKKSMLLGSIHLPF